MKTLKNSCSGTIISEIKGLETLNGYEMYKIRGGSDDDKIGTKDIDIYDTRED